MADTKISALTSATTPLAGTEVLPIVQSGSTKKVSVANLTVGRQVGFSSYNIGITAFTPTAAGTISDGTDNSTTEKVTELLTVADDNTWKTSGASFATYRTWLNTTGIRLRVSNGGARYTAWDLSPAGNFTQAVAGEGINFTANSAAAGKTSQLLNWYEEGTWTPVYKSGSGSFTTMTMDVTSAVYTRIGRQVTVTAHIKTTSVNATGASGDLYIDGLPFTCNYRAPVQIGVAAAFSTNFPLSGFIFPGTGFFYLEYRATVTGTTSICQIATLTTGAVAGQNELVFSATYFV